MLGHGAISEHAISAFQEEQEEQGQLFTVELDDTVLIRDPNCFEFPAF